jgi:predicted permease
VLLSGAALLLIVACINVGSLLLVRTESRRHEIAVRGALGASPKRLLRQFAIEALVLAGISSVIGVTFASVAMHLLPRLIPPDMLATMPYLHGLGLNGRVLAFSGGVLVAMETVFALTPTARLSWSEMRAGLGEGGRSSVGRLWRRLGSSLVIVELAVALVLLSGAGLLCRSLYRLLRVNIGFVPERLVTMQIEPPDAEYGNDAKVIALEGSIVHRISALPGVKSIGAANRLPVGDGDGTSNILLIGRSQGKHYEVNDRQVGANYFQTIGAQLLRGRYFAESEDASKPRVVIINQAFAERLFPGEDPIGKHIGYRGPHLNRMEIVGVVSNIKEGPLDMTVRPAFYVPFNQAPSRWMSIVIRTSQDERSLLPVLSAILHEIDRGIAVYSVTTMEQRINESPSTYLHRSAAWLAGGFAVIALLLGVVGLYGVIAYSVSQRTREIGVRMALGARRTTVYGMVLHEALRLILVGISAGVAGSLLTTGLLRPLLYGVRPWDATTLGGVAVLLGIAALFATYVPARRAASVNPVDALRAE